MSTIDASWTTFTATSPAESLSKLASTWSGLSESEAQNRLAANGLNEVALPTTPVLKLLLRQFSSPFLYLLLGAALITGLLESTLDASLIIIFILINTSLGFLQEWRSTKTIASLRHFLESSCRVKRNGKMQHLKSKNLVIGDLIVIAPGDILPADVRFLEVTNLNLDESTRTGESQVVAKTSNAISAVTSEFAALNIGFAGTTVVSGQALGAVIATGAQSSIGRLQKAASVIHQPSIIERDITKISRVILLLVGFVLVALFVTSLMFNKSTTPIELLVFSVALAISVIPEALPTVLTFSLSIGASRLSKKNVVVKTLFSIEDLGGIEVLATDKTGTLTENKMSVVDVLSADRNRLLFAGSVSPADPADPFELACAEGLSPVKNPPHAHVLGTLPFDPRRRRTTCLIETPSGLELIVRGAPETVLSLCRLSKTKHLEAIQWLTAAGLQGHRIWAVGVAHPKKPSSDLQHLESASKFTFLGLIAFQDRIKDTTASAISAAKSLGVVCKILTGDAPEVAGYVAHSIGLISNPKEVLLGTDFLKLNDAAKLVAVEKCHVFARVTPEAKNAIVDTLQLNHTVGFLGEGINDAIALKSADVGLAVDTASEVAKEAADIVLLKKDLKVIVDGIAEGRKIGRNVQKYLLGTLSANFGNFFALSIASIVGHTLPMLPMQILLVNLLSDFPMVSIATDSVDPVDVVAPQRFTLAPILKLALFLGIISTIFDLLFFAIFKSLGTPVLHTNWFMGSVLTELVFLFSFRTSRFFLQSIRPSAPLILLSLLAAVITVSLPFTPLGRLYFDFIQPTSAQLLTTVSLVAGFFFATESAKLVYYSRRIT